MGGLSGSRGLIARGSDGMMECATCRADALRLHKAVHAGATSYHPLRLVDDRVGHTTRLTKRRALTLPVQCSHLCTDCLTLRQVLSLQRRRANTRRDARGVATAETGTVP